MSNYEECAWYHTKVSTETAGCIYSKLMLSVYTDILMSQVWKTCTFFKWQPTRAGIFIDGGIMDQLRFLLNSDFIDHTWGSGLLGHWRTAGYILESLFRDDGDSFFWLRSDVCDMVGRWTKYCCSAFGSSRCFLGSNIWITLLDKVSDTPIIARMSVLPRHVGLNFGLC